MALSIDNRGYERGGWLRRGNPEAHGRVTIFWTIRGVRKWSRRRPPVARRCFLHGYSDFDWLFAFGQVRRPHSLADVELVFQRDDFGSDVTTGGRGLLENVIGGESGHHVR